MLGEERGKHSNRLAGVAYCYQSSCICTPDCSSHSTLPTTRNTASTRIPECSVSSSSDRKPMAAASSPTSTPGLPPRSPPLPVLVSKKHKTRRGKRNSDLSYNNRSNTINSYGSWILFHSNIRGFNSKKTSLNNIISVINPNVITLNEVGLRGKKKCSITGYNTYTRNRKQHSMGGIATGVRKDESKFCLKIDEGENNDEFMITRHSQFLKPINIINCYGEQEGKKQQSGYRR